VLDEATVLPLCRFAVSGRGPSDFISLHSKIELLVGDTRN